MKSAPLTASYERLKFISSLIRLDSLAFRMTNFDFASGKGGRRGGYAEFVGFREYTASDDARFISHIASARLGEPMMKILTKEAEEKVFFLLDHSLSMFCPSKNSLKYFIASSLIAAIFMKMQKKEGNMSGLLFGETVEKVIFKMGSAKDFLKILQKPPEKSFSSSLSAALAFAEKYSKGSILLIASDFRMKFDEAFFTYLAKTREIVVLYIKSPFDEKLSSIPFPYLHDVESGEEVYISKTFDREYREKALMRERKLQKLCLSSGAKLVSLSTENSLEEAALAFSEVFARKKS